MSDDEERLKRTTVIGGRHGSPTVTVALPFSKITRVDSDVRDAVVDLAGLVARLASVTADGSSTDAAAVAAAAQELAAQLSSRGD